jgi:hypothetical protein
MMPPPPLRHCESRQASQHSKYETFGKQLHHEPSATHAECDAHGDLTPASECTREQQVRDVGACDQQHDDRNATEPRRDLRFASFLGATIAEHRTGERMRLRQRERSELGLRVELLLVAQFECVREIGRRGLYGHTRFAARESLEPDHVVCRVPLGIHARRRRGNRKKSGHRLIRKGEESFGCDADDGVFLRSYVDNGADYFFLATVLRLPKCVRKNGDVFRVQHVAFLFAKESADHRLDVEHLPHVRSADGNFRFSSRVPGSNDLRARVERRHRVERLGFLLQVEESTITQTALDVLLTAECVRDIEATRAIRRDQKIRRTKEQPVDDSEHRRVRANTQTERDDHRKGEPRLQAEPA